MVNNDVCKVNPEKSMQCTDKWIIFTPCVEENVFASVNTIRTRLTTGKIKPKSLSPKMTVGIQPLFTGVIFRRVSQTGVQSLGSV